jgi:hypothetical protein
MFHIFIEPVGKFLNFLHIWSSALWKVDGLFFELINKTLFQDEISSFHYVDQFISLRYLCPQLLKFLSILKLCMLKHYLKLVCERQ